MADLWAHLFDSEWKQRDDIERALQLAEATDGDGLETARLLGQARSQLRHLEGRLERTELLLAGLVGWLELEQGLTRDALALLVQRADLGDGVEDGRIGPSRSAEAPRCAGCGRPRSPTRLQCVFCGAAALTGGEAPARRVPCVRCGEAVEEHQTWFTAAGLVCGACEGAR
jgi:hypothetical protein